MQRASWMWHTLCSEEILVGHRFLGTLKDELRVCLKRGLWCSYAGGGEVIVTA